MQEFLDYLEASNNDAQQITDTQSETIPLNQNPTKKHKSRTSNKTITYRIDTNLYCDSEELKKEYEEVLLPLIISASKMIQAKGEIFCHKMLAEKIGITTSTFYEQFTKHPATVKFKNDLYNYYIEHLDELDADGPKLLQLLSVYKRKKYPRKSSVPQNTKSVTTVEPASIVIPTTQTISLVLPANNSEVKKHIKPRDYTQLYLFARNDKKQAVKKVFEGWMKPEPQTKRQKPNS